MNLIKRGLSTLKDDGVTEFLSSVLSYVHKDLTKKKKLIIFRLEILKGEQTLSVNSTKGRFAASDKTVVRRNRKRVEEEKDDIEFLMSNLNGDDVFYDIGANTGLYSIFAANKCQNCQVIAFEPYPPNISVLKENIKLNEGNISVLDVALSNKSGKMDLSVPQKETPSHGTGSLVAQNSESTQSVCTARGDELIDEDKIPPPNIVKIDVEGAEPLVIDGLFNALSHERCRCVCCELHLDHLDECGSSVSDIISKFDDLGFEVELKKRWRDDLVIHAVK